MPVQPAAAAPERDRVPQQITVLIAAAFVIAIGYGIVTVDTIEQARARAFTDRGDKGGDAAHACLAMVALGRRWRNA